MIAPPSTQLLAQAQRRGDAVQTILDFGSGARRMPNTDAVRDRAESRVRNLWREVHPKSVVPTSVRGAAPGRRAVAFVRAFHVVNQRAILGAQVHQRGSEHR